MIWVLGFLVLILALLLGVSIVGHIRSIRKIEMYEMYILDAREEMASIINRMRKIDHQGAFEAHDEVGVIFGALKNMIYELELFLAGVNTDNEKKTNQR